MWLEAHPAPGVGPPPLRHSASFSCLPRGRPHRSRTGTLPASETDYGFVVRGLDAVRLRNAYKFGIVPEEEESEYLAVSRVPHQTQGKKDVKDASSIREVLLKKSASLLSPTAWWPRRGKEMDSHQRRWRSLGALLKTPPSTTPSHPPAPSPRAESFYLLDDFLKPSHQQKPPRRSRAVEKPPMTILTTSSSDSLELSSPVPPPVPPPPPPLRLQVRSNKLTRRNLCCECNQCGRNNCNPSSLHVQDSSDTVCFAFWWWDSNSCPIKYYFI